MWWVFPLQRVHHKDPDKTRVANSLDVKYLLSYNGDLWKRIIRFLIACANHGTWEDLFRGSVEEDMQRVRAFTLLMKRWEKDLVNDHPEFISTIDELATSLERSERCILFRGPRSISTSARRLRRAQEENFQMIRNDMLTCHKSGHWIWWMFPTRFIGAHDPHRTSIQNIDDYMYVLENERSRKEWNAILTALARCCQKRKARPSLPGVFPDWDEARLNTFSEESVQYFKDIPECFQDYKRALYEFVNAKVNLNLKVVPTFRGYAETHGIMDALKKWGLQ